MLRLRGLSAGGLVRVSLETDGPGAGNFAVGSGSKHGIQVASALGPLTFDLFSVSRTVLELIASTDMDMVEINLQVELLAIGLRGQAETPPGASLRIMTIHDQTTVIERSSWWVLFGDEPPGRDRAGLKEIERKQASAGN